MAVALEFASSAAFAVESAGAAEAEAEIVAEESRERTAGSAAGSEVAGPEDGLADLADAGTAAAGDFAVAVGVAEVVVEVVEAVGVAQVVSGFDFVAVDVAAIATLDFELHDFLA